MTDTQIKMMLQMIISEIDGRRAGQSPEPGDIVITMAPLSKPARDPDEDRIVGTMYLKTPKKKKAPHKEKAPLLVNGVRYKLDAGKRGRAPNWVLALAKVKSKPELVEKYGDGAVFTEGGPLPEQV